MRASKLYVSGRIHRPMSGSGMGSVLLREAGGAGGGSSYASVSDYENVTGHRVPVSGNGLGKKLESLIVKPISKKPKNIHF